MKDREQVRRFIIKVFAFGLFAAFTYLILLLIFGISLPNRLKKNLSYRRASGYTLTRLQEAKRTHDVDILFLGSSHAFRGFDPRIFSKAGYKTFNLGTMAQTPSETELLVDRYIDKMQPRIVVYEVYGKTFCLDGIESASDIISNDKNDLFSLILAADHPHLKIVNTLLFSELLDFLNLDRKSETYTVKGDEYVAGGYVSCENTTYEVHHPEESWITLEEKFVIFERIIRKLESRNIKLLLVQAPIPQARYQQITNRQDFDTKIAKYGPYLNFNYITAVNDTLDFYDTHHLNQNGVAKFNNDLIPHLKMMQ